MKTHIEARDVSDGLLFKINHDDLKKTLKEDRKNNPIVPEPPTLGDLKSELHDIELRLKNAEKVVERHEGLLEEHSSNKAKIVEVLKALESDTSRSAAYERKQWQDRLAGVESDIALSTRQATNYGNLVRDGKARLKEFPMAELKRLQAIEDKKFSVMRGRHRL